MALKEWYFGLHDSSTGQYKSGMDASGWAMVCTAGAVTSPTIYTNASGSATLTATNTIAVVTIANGYCRFWTDSSVTSLDISYLTATGECGLLKAVSPNTQHMLPVQTGQMDFTLWVPVAYLAASAVVDTTLDLPANLIITDAMLKVVATDSAVTVDVGFENATESGDLDGLLDGMLCTNAGLILGSGTITNGSNIDYVANTNGKYGVLLATVIAGADAVATVGGITRLWYETDGTIKSLVYTPSNSTTFTGAICLKYMRTMS